MIVFGEYGFIVFGKKENHKIFVLFYDNKLQFAESRYNTKYKSIN